MTYRPEIDGMRAIAVLAVILYHLDGLIPFGFVGVDLFFVISGFVVTKSVLDRREQEGHAIRDFYVRRFKRLFPALALMLAIVTAAGVALVSPREFAGMATAGAAAALGFSNWVLLAQNADYFGVGAELNLFTHTWSLGVEEQFYLLVAPALILIRDTRRLHGLILVVTVASLLAYLLAPDSTRFYATPMRLWQLGGGVLLALFVLPEAIRGYGSLWSSAGLVCLASAMWLPYANSLLASAGGLLLIMGTGIETDGRGPLLKRVLASGVATYIGKLSYSLYLWHWPVIVLAKWTLGVGGPVAQVLIVMISFGLASASYHFWETPLRRSRWTPFHGGVGAIQSYARLLAFPLAAALVIPATARVVGRAMDDPFVPPAFSNLPSANDWGDAGERCHHRYTDLGEAAFIAQCLPKPVGSRSLYLVGDSHAIQLGFAFERAIETGATSFDSFAVIHNDGIPGLLERGTTPREVEYLLRQMTAGDVLAITLYRGKLFPDGTILAAGADPFASPVTRERMAHLESSLMRIAAAVGARGATLLLIDDGPRLGLNVRASACLVGLSLSGKDPCEVSAAQSRHDRLPLSTVLRQVNSAQPDVRIWDYHDLVCAQRCGVMSADGALLMIDHNHISRRTSLALAVPLKTYLARTFPPLT